MNATYERLIGTLRREVLDRTLILGDAHLRAILTEYQMHCNTARPHQGIEQQIPDGNRDSSRATLTDLDTGRIHRRRVLGGLISEYTYAALPTDNPQVTGPNRISERHRILRSATRRGVPAQVTDQALSSGTSRQMVPPQSALAMTRLAGSGQTW